MTERGELGQRRRAEMKKRILALLVSVPITLSAGGGAAQVSNLLDKDGGVNTYQGGVGDGNWVGTFAGVTPNAGSQFFGSANGNVALDFQDIGLTKALGQTIVNRTYEVSFFTTKYTAFPATSSSGVELADFSTLRIGGAGGSMSWSSTPTPIVDAVWVKWVGTYKPSATDIGSPFQFIAIFNLDAGHSIGIDGPVVVAIPHPPPIPSVSTLGLALTVSAIALVLAIRRRRGPALR